MVFEMMRYCFILVLVLFALPDQLSARDWVEGLSASLRLGTFLDHPTGRDIIELREALEEDNPDLLNFGARPVRSQPGLDVSVALGVRLSFSESIRLRSEFEVGYQRGELEVRIRDNIFRREEGRGYKDAVLFLWNNYFYFLPQRSLHQPWVGFGLGGASQRWRFYFLERYQDDFNTDFALALALGYDYRLTAQFGVGVQYRYVHIFDGASDSKQSQLRAGLTYGF